MAHRFSLIGICDKTHFVIDRPEDKAMYDTHWRIHEITYEAF